MNSRKNICILSAAVSAACLLSAAVTAVLVSYCCGRLQFGLLNALCREAAQKAPGAEQILLSVLKDYTRQNVKPGTDVLPAWGYHWSDFSLLAYKQTALCIAAGFCAAVLLCTSAFLCRSRTEAGRIQALADYLEQACAGRAAICSASGEDDFSRLEDQIYKTTAYLYQTKEEAVQAKDGFAQNLSNIAHQIKTPLTAISLALQMLKLDGVKSDHLKQAEKQLTRLTHLEESLLLLSRIDAGTLVLHENDTDVYTLLVLAADNLQELFAASGTSVYIPEQGEILIAADPDWTMEAVMNLMKNCMEHNPGGMVHISYDRNPLYTQILIWDDGKGFAKEDLPHLFERFYRGQNTQGSGTGIGLALSKEIIERQNGTVRARNKPGAGALFEIRFYRH